MVGPSGLDPSAARRRRGVKLVMGLSLLVPASADFARCNPPRGGTRAAVSGRRGSCGRGERPGRWVGGRIDGLNPPLPFSLFF